MVVIVDPAAPFNVVDLPRAEEEAAVSTTAPAVEVRVGPAAFCADSRIRCAMVSRWVIVGVLLLVDAEPVVDVGLLFPLLLLLSLPPCSMVLRYTTVPINSDSITVTGFLSGVIQKGHFK